MIVENYTGHPIAFSTGLKIESSGSVQASQLITQKENIAMEQQNGSIPLYELLYHPPVLPQEKEGTIIIVAKMICELSRNRSDLYCVYGVVRNRDNGKPMYAKGLVRNPYFIS